MFELNDSKELASEIIRRIKRIKDRKLLGDIVNSAKVGLLIGA